MAEDGNQPRRCIIALPPRGDCESRTEESWSLSCPDGVEFRGQRFLLPEGCAVEAGAQWLEPSLLSVSISLRAEAVGVCDRCLKETTLAISDVLMYLYYSRGLEFGKDTELESDDGFMPVEVDYLGRTLDIGPQVQESLLLLLPTKLLCRPDCAGLCSRCGADLDQGPCSCPRDEGDPRFEALRLVRLEEP